MNGYTKSEIMKCAWEFAKNAAKKFGGKAKQYLSECLKKVWAKVKCTRRVIVPAWFIQKKLCVRFGSERKFFGFVRKETEKAVLAYIGEVEEEMWIPKSILL